MILVYNNILFNKERKYIIFAILFSKVYIFKSIYDDLPNPRKVVRQSRFDDR